MAGDLANRQKVGYALLVAARVMKNFDAVAALLASRKLDRAHLMPILFPDLGVGPDATDRQISVAYETRISAPRNHGVAPHTRPELRCDA